MHQTLLKTFKEIIPLTSQEETLVLEYFTSGYYEAKEYLLSLGDMAEKIFFIEKGLVRVSLLDINSEDITFNFKDKHEFVTDYESFLNQKPSSFALQAMENTHCFEIKKDDFDKMCQTLKMGNLIAKNLMDKSYVEFKDRLVAFYKEEPEERYLKLFGKISNLFNRVPQNYLASFIGVTPQYFSVIKRKYMEEQRKKDSD